MLALFLYVIGAIFALLIGLLLVYAFIIYPIRTRRLRRRPQVNDWCKFYRNETKHSGKIIEVLPISVKVSFVNSIGRGVIIEIHNSRLYAAW